MRIASKATKGKGKRWKKGCSSDSNPAIKKYRQLAKSGNLQPVSRTITPNLTEDVMAQHNAIQLKNLDLNANSDLSITNQDDIETTASVTSFASVWTNCTNASFSKFLGNFKASSVLHREMLAVLGTVSDIIHEKGGSETETEYFGALMTALETVEHDEALTAIIWLLNLVLRRLPPAVIKVKFSETSKVLLEYLSRFVNGDNGILVRSLISSIGILLKHQEYAVWQLSSTKQVYEALLLLTTHNKPRIRKASHKIVAGILRNKFDNMKNANCHPVANLTSQFCVRKIEELNVNENMNMALYIMELMKLIIPILSNADIRRCSEIILQLMALGNAVFVNCALKVFYELFYNQPDKQLLTPELNAQLISAFYNYQPNINDTQPLCSWLAVMKQAFLNLNRLNSKLSFSHLPKLFGVVVPCWLSDSNEVHVCVADLLKSVFTNCVEPSFEEIGKEVLEKVFASLKSALKYQYFNSWGIVFNVLGHFINKNCQEFLLPALTDLAEMREENNFKYTTELDYVFGCAVKEFGPRVIIETCPIDLTGENNLANTWLLPILKSEMQAGELSYFINHFIPAAMELQNKIEFYESQNRTADAKTFSVLFTQIWSLLPAFCIKPIDFSESFKNIAKTLGTILSEKKDLRCYVLEALKNLILNNGDDDDIKKELARFAKNFIPILFNLYTTNSIEVQQCSIILHVLQLYFSISNHQLISSLYLKVKEKLNNSKRESSYGSLMDLIRLFIPYVGLEDLQQIYGIAFENIKEDTNKFQKKGYLLIAEICQCDSINCQQFISDSIDEILNGLINSLLVCSISAKFAVMRSIKIIIEKEQNSSKSRSKKVHSLFLLFIRNIIESFVTNHRRLKVAATSLFNSMFKVCLSLTPDGHLKMIEDILKFLDYSTESFSFISATILALTKLFVGFFDKISIDYQNTIIKSILDLTKLNDRQVIKHSLEFMKCLLLNTQEFLSPHFECIYQSLFGINENHKLHFRTEFKEMLTRLVRKFGFEIVLKVTPENSVYLKILRNIRKTEMRKNKKSKKDSNSSTSGKKKYESIKDIVEETESSDEEGEDLPSIDNTKHKIWIEDDFEGEVLDLLSNKAMSHMTSTDPSKDKAKPKKEHFQVSKDGKLIIENDESRGMKRQLDESEDESEVSDSEDETTSIQANKGSKYKTGGRGIHRDVRKSLGDEYKSKKAGGDMKKKGKPDPFAYIPLNMQALNKRKRGKFKGQFKNIVKSAQKGANRGKRLKQSGKR